MKNGATNKKTSIESTNGMGVVMSEGNLKAWVMGQQVQASVDIGETLATNVDRIVVDLEKIISMIK
jgi:hypothetical protein